MPDASTTLAALKDVVRAFCEARDWDRFHGPRDRLVMPIAWRGTLVQYTGRLHRVHPGKKEVVIYDYVDREVPVLAKMSRSGCGGTGPWDTRCWRRQELRSAGRR